MSNNKKIAVVVLCSNASGEPEFFHTTVELTSDAYNNGDHYDIAKSRAENEGYDLDPASVAFDENDTAFKQLKTLWHEAKGEPVVAVTPTIVIDMDGGLIQDISADAAVRVIVLDADIEGGDDEPSIIDGSEVYVSDYQLKLGVDHDYVTGVVGQVDKSYLTVDPEQTPSPV